MRPGSRGCSDLGYLSSVRIFVCTQCLLDDIHCQEPQSSCRNEAAATLSSRPVCHLSGALASLPLVVISVGRQHAQGGTLVAAGM